MSKQRVLITGGRGDIASGMSAILKNLNYEVSSPGKAELDVVNSMSISNYFDDSEKFDVLINNAGEIYLSDLKDSNIWLWENVVNVNLFGTYRMCREAIRRNDNVTVINIASMSAYQYFKSFSAYASSKAGVVALTKCLAAEGINAYTVCPGSVDTKFRQKLLKNMSNGEIEERYTCHKDMLMPIEIGEIVSDILNKKYESGSSILIRKNDIFEVR